MKRKSLIALIVCVILGSVCLAAAVASADLQQKQISSKLIRLHVIANSDADNDQSLKLQVKNALVKVLNKQSWHSRAEAEAWIIENLDALSQCAMETLQKLGSEQSAQAELVTEYYPVRNYDTFSLPAGEYLSLRIILGEGQGKNWWCVVYPSLCFSTAGEFEEVAVSSGFQESEVRIITEGKSGFKLRFKLLDLFKKICRFLQDT